MMIESLMMVMHDVGAGWRRREIGFCKELGIGS